MKINRLAAVLPGLIAVLIVNVVLNLGVLSVVYLLGRASAGPDALVAFRGSTLQWALGLLTGSLAIGAGGFASTWLARDAGLMTALAFGATYLAISLVSALFRPPTTPWWMFAVSLVLVFPAAAAGGYLARRRA